MNLLVTHRELDIAGYHMLELLAEKPDIQVYITASTEEERNKVKGKCVPLMIPPLRSKIVWKAIKALRGFIKQCRINVVYSPSSSGLSNGLMASWGTQAKNLAYRGTQARVKRTDITYYLGVLNPRLDHMICATRDIKESLSEFINEKKLTVIPKSFDTAWVEPSLQHPKTVEGLPEDAVCCVTLANTKGRPFKGLTYLIRAFYRIEDTRLHLIFAGDYDESDFELAQKGIQEGRIHFLGERKDAVDYIPLQDIFVLPSLRDAAPRAVKEAMACGLPCIVTDIPGARDLPVNNVTGLLVPPASPEALAEAIQILMNDSEKRKRFGRAGRERIIQHFSMEKYVNSFEEVIKKL